MPDEIIGKTFGSYKVVSPLGQGGMASVYRGYQESIERYVAIKVLPAELLHDPTFLKRFANEARTLARLQHPNILPLFDFGEANRVPYIITPLMSGGTLADRIKRGPLAPAEAAQIIQPIADALEYAHGQGILHRDIKPNNILFDARGAPVLADFGIAKYAESASSLTGTAIIGTPDYMSPEQARGEPLDHRSDIYSLAVVVYQMLTGQPMFQATTPMSVLFKHVSEQPRSLRDLRPNIPPAVEAVVMKSLAKFPAGRHQTVTEFARALAEAATVRTRPMPEPAATIAVTGADLPAAPSTQQVASPVTGIQPPPSKPAPPRRGGGLWMWLGAVGAVIAIAVCVTVALGALGIGVLGTSVAATSQAQTVTAATAIANQTQVAQAATQQAAAAEATAAFLALPINRGGSWSVAYRDDFSGSTGQWPDGNITDTTRARGGQRIFNGLYVWNVTALDSLHLRGELADQHSVGDFYLTFTARRVLGPTDSDYGPTFRVSSRNHYYFAVRDTGFYSFYRFQNNQWTTLIDLAETDAVRPGAANTIAVVAEGSHFTFYVNNRLVAEVDDAALASGTVGIAIDLSKDERASYEFDDFELRAP